MGFRALRGATTVERDDVDEIISATGELLAEVIRANDLDGEQIVSILFTATDDLHAAFPARAAREIGYPDVPVTCARELDVDGMLPRCIRLLMHVESSIARSELRHVFLRDAASLRPDLLTDQGADG